MHHKAAASGLKAVTRGANMIMKSASILAKQYGLEQYLDKPAALNEIILKLLLLQETIQIENAGRERRSHPQARVISVKRVGSGKLVAGCCGDEKYRYAVETALKASTSTIAVFQRTRFVSVLRSMGVPEERIEEFCETMTIDDDTYCIDQE